MSSGKATLLALAAALVLGAVAMSIVHRSPARSDWPSREFIRGVTVSCQTSGSEWARPEMAMTLDELKVLGAGWIAIHPYARVHADGSLRFPNEAQPPQIVKPLAWARDRGMGVMLVPHIAYWGSPFSWRGAINFANQADWDRFFTDYESWIVPLAQLAEEGGASMFCIGLEYSFAQQFEARWRHIIREVRGVYHGRVTYGANWTDFETVPFWDAVDDIGVLAYFPLSTKPEPLPQEIAAGWKPWLQRLEKVSAKYGKPVVFTEIGYDESVNCAERPWEPARRSERVGAQLQARCLAQALALEQRRLPWLAGMFLWKWFPDVPSHEVESFDLRAPALKQVLRTSWGSAVADR